MKYFIAYICIYSDIFSHKMWTKRDREKERKERNEYTKEEKASCKQVHLSRTTYPKLYLTFAIEMHLVYCFIISRTHTNVKRYNNILKSKPDSQFSKAFELLIRKRLCSFYFIFQMLYLNCTMLWNKYSTCYFIIDIVRCYMH